MKKDNIIKIYNLKGCENYYEKISYGKHSAVLA